MRIFKTWLPSFLWMGLIFILSSRSRVSLTANSSVDFVIFKSLHMLEYGILFILNYRALKKTLFVKTVNFLAIAFLITVIYAFFDEIHQLFTPTREGRLRDVFFDGMGAVVVGGLLWKLKPIRRKKPKS